jgi:hypothetical protein
MADLDDKDSAQTVKLVGVNTSGIETNYVDATVNGIKVDGSAVTQPISAASLPLPTGASTSASQTTMITTLNSIDAGIPAALGQTTMSASMPVSIASDQSNVPAGISIGNNYAPTVPYTQVSVGRLMTDPDNQLIIRGDVLTDEGTFRDDFTGNNLSVQRWTSSSTGNSSISVVNSFVTLNSGTGTNNRVSITAVGDYGPISFRSQLSISQRIANQTTRLGFADNTAAPNIFAQFNFSGTDNTVVDCVTASSSAATDLQTTTIKIPNGTSATINTYYIEVQPDQVSFVINNILVAQHSTHIPGPYDSVNVSCFIQNSGAVTATTLSIDYIYFINQNALQVTNSFVGDPIQVQVQSGTVQTYSATILNLVAANIATDIFTLTGSATKTVKIQNIYISATQTTASNANIAFIKRSTANTAGTSTLPTVIPMDSTNAAGTAVVRAYTANPTLGTTVGTIYARKLFVSTTTTIGSELQWMTAQDTNTQPIVLRGANEVLAINLNSTTLSGNSFNISIIWTEN